LQDRGPENLPLNDMELEDEIEEEHETNGINYISSFIILEFGSVVSVCK